MESSPFQPICPYVAVCGGCETQHIPYSLQVIEKDKALKNLFQSLLSSDDPRWETFIHSPDEYPLFFRNKIRYGFVQNESGIISASRHAKGVNSADIAVDACYLQSENSIEVMNWLANYATAHSWSIYDPEKGKGWLKHVLIRESKTSGEQMIALVTDLAEIPQKEQYVQEITNSFTQATSLYHIQTWGKSNEKTELTHLFGKEKLYETVGEYHFAISPLSFFQTNGSMVETLYSAIQNHCGIGGNILWDLYAGSATIGIYLNNLFKTVFSIEENPQNITDAEENNQLNTCSVIIKEGKVESVITSAFIAENDFPSHIVVDPPRAGLSEKIRTILPQLSRHTLIYVSCNPLTALRDCRDLLQKGYFLEAIQGIDMFPHTHHCEMIIRLRNA